MASCGFRTHHSRCGLLVGPLYEAEAIQKIFINETNVQQPSNDFVNNGTFRFKKAHTQFITNKKIG